MEREMDAVPAMATWGLLVAWAVHDAEEVATAPGWARRARPRLERRLPWVPPAVWDRFTSSQAHMALAVGLMGVLVAAAAADGARTGGRSPLYQFVLTGFGAHGFGHLAAAVATGGYAPGVVTSPSVVLPFAWWARRALRRAGVPQAPVPPAALALIPVAIGAAHSGAAGLLRLRARAAR
jgi:hypothetical protein